MLRGLVNKTPDEKFDSVIFEDQRLWESAEARPSGRQVNTMTGPCWKSRLNCYGGSDRQKGNQHCCERRAGEGRPTLEIFLGWLQYMCTVHIDEWPASDEHLQWMRNVESVFRDVRKPIPGLPPWNDVTVGSKLRRYKTRPARAAEVMVIETVNDLFAAVVDYRDDGPLKTSSCYDNNIAHQLHKISKWWRYRSKTATFPEETRCR